jgi:flagellar basal-body rod modification protein FlgD
MTTQQTLSGNFNTFLTLLTSQLKNQDPLDPVDSAAFTQQLVQYSQVEQQLQTNDKLDKVLTQSASANMLSAAGYIGRTAEFSSAVATLKDDAAEWRYAVTGSVGPVQLNVVDATGQTVFSKDVASANGAQTFNWNGKNSAGAEAADGPYRLVVKAVDEAGKALEASVAVRERITGVDFSSAALAFTTASGARSFDTAIQLFE